MKFEYRLPDLKMPIGVAEWRTRLVEPLTSMADLERVPDKLCRAKAGRKPKL